MAIPGEMRTGWPRGSSEGIRSLKSVMRWTNSRSQITIARNMAAKTKNASRSEDLIVLQMTFGCSWLIAAPLWFERGQWKCNDIKVQFASGSLFC
jgi:hypothetical protein